jgi:hypothetical protein
MRILVFVTVRMAMLVLKLLRKNVLGPWAKILVVGEFGAWRKMREGRSS